MRLALLVLRHFRDARYSLCHHRAHSHREVFDVFGFVGSFLFLNILSTFTCLLAKTKKHRERFKATIERKQTNGKLG